jgi:DNA polymerase-1
MSKQEVTLLLDSDIVAFKYASTNQTKFNWGDGVESEYVNEDFEAICRDVDACLKGYLEVTKADKLIVCLSDPDVNWRNSVLPSYKGNRDPNAKPKLLKRIKDYMASYYPSYLKSTLEADDCMGILSTHPKLLAGKKIIVSEDKDMKTIPGWLYNPRKDTKPRLVSTLEANLYHMRQTLTGDPTDFYKGCPGAGDKAFDKLLIDWVEGDWYDLWKRVVSVYESKGLSEYDALIQARVARICRHTEYNFNKGEVDLWIPPTQPK